MTTPSVGTPLCVLAIDPGVAKCGVAIVCRAADAPARAQRREVVETERLIARVLSLLADRAQGAEPIEAVLIGNGTRGAVLRRALADALPPDFPLHAVEEAFTSQRARARFQIENPPRGWQKWVPPGLRTPPRPYDDYVAVLLAEDWFAASAK